MNYLTRALLFALLISGLLWCFTPYRTADSPSGARHVTDSDLPTQTKNRPPSELQCSIAAPSAENSPTTPDAATLGLPQPATLVQSAMIPTASGSRRISIFRSSFKYPLLRTVEEFSGNSKPAHISSMVADHLMVSLTAATESRLQRFLKQFPEVTVRDRLADGELVLLQIPRPESPTAIDEWQTRLRAAGFANAGPDFLQHHCATTPNDPEFPQLWGLQNTGQSSGTNDADIDAPEAWSVTTGSSNVIVAVVDSGVDLTHPDLAANLWTNAQGKHGYDYFDKDDDPSDTASIGHGTHVSGTIAAVGNNGIGVCGVAWNAKIMALRFLGTGGTGATSDAISCINYAVNNGAKIISNSWGSSSGYTNDALNRAITNARNKGVLFVAAAGNNGTDNDIYPFYPANYNVANIITVAATDRKDALASLSNFSSTKVHIAAPGIEIRSTWLSGGYNTISGTSMAAPHVSGAAALLLAADPTLTYTQIRSRLLTYGDTLPALSGKVSSGRRLNAFNAIEDLTGSSLALTTKIITEISGNSDGYANPGETFGLNLTLANNGNLPTTNSTVTASLSSGAPATLDRTTLNAGALASKASISLPNAFQVTLSTPATLPATFTIHFVLSTPDSTRTWSDSLEITLYQSATIQGTVSRAATAAPIANATVTLEGTAARTLQTDADGHYQANLIAGDYQLTATATGLLASETISLTSVSGSRTQDFTLGTAAISIDPPTLDLTIPPDQTRSVEIAAVHTGDSPRTLPFQVSISGTGLSQEHLYGLDITGTQPIVLELNPDTGAEIASHTISSLTSQDTLSIAATADSLWLLTWENYSTYQLVPLSTSTWTTGTPIPINTGMVMSIGSSPDAVLIVATNSTTGALDLHTYTPTTGVFVNSGTLPDWPTGPIAASSTRQSIFTPMQDQSVRELLRSDFSLIREWSPTGNYLTSISYSDAQNVIFTAGQVFTTNGMDYLVEKRSPDTGAVLSGFQTPSNISHVACQSITGAKWITCDVESSDVATNAFRTLPLTFSTADMTLGQSFTATLEVRSSLLTSPTSLTVNLTVANPPPDPNSWDGWFLANYLRAPTASDETTDTDGDGVPTLLEFATGGDPNSPIPHAGLPKKQSIANGRIEWTYLRRKSLTAAQLTPQGTGDLNDWQTLPTGNTDSIVTESTYDADFQQIVVSVPITTEAYFFRIRVSR